MTVLRYIQYSVENYLLLHQMAPDTSLLKLPCHLLRPLPNNQQILLPAFKEYAYRKYRHTILSNSSGVENLIAILIGIIFNMRARMV